MYPETPGGMQHPASSCWFSRYEVTTGVKQPRRVDILASTAATLFPRLAFDDDAKLLV